MVPESRRNTKRRNSRREVSACSGKNGDKDVVSRRDLTHLVAEFIVKVAGHSVKLGRTVKSDNGNAAIVGKLNFLVRRHLVYMVARDRSVETKFGTK